jgi:hypothetical protein
MTKEQALQVIKQALDQAVKSGVFTSLSDTQVIITAFQTIAQELTKDK